MTQLTADLMHDSLIRCRGRHCGVVQMGIARQASANSPASVILSCGLRAWECQVCLLRKMIAECRLRGMDETGLRCSGPEISDMPTYAQTSFFILSQLPARE